MWGEVFIVFIVSHLVGDYLLQTNWQAANKMGGLGRDPLARRALLAHIANYTLAYVPAFVWLLDDVGAGVVFVAALIAGPHLVQDDGRLLDTYLRRVKHCDPVAMPGLRAMVDQSFHVLALFAVALVVGT